MLHKLIKKTDKHLFFGLQRKLYLFLFQVAV